MVGETMPPGVIVMNCSLAKIRDVVRIIVTLILHGRSKVMGLGAAGPARLAMGLLTVWSHNLFGRHNSRLCSYYVCTEYGGNNDAIIKIEADTKNSNCTVPILFILKICFILYGTVLLKKII